MCTTSTAINSSHIVDHLLDNDQVHVDFQPLHQCIHIYTALSILPELKASYQADRKTQASLIISTIPSSLPSPTTSASTASNVPTLQQILPPLTHELVGFFVIELEVLRTTVGFRSMLQVEELWQDVVDGLIELVENGTRYEKDGRVLATIKDTLTVFLQVIEVRNIIFQREDKWGIDDLYLCRPSNSILHHYRH